MGIRGVLKKGAKDTDDVTQDPEPLPEINQNEKCLRQFL